MQTRNIPQKINMRVTTSPYETSGKKMHICSVIIYPLEKNFIGTSSSLARGKSSVLLTDSLVTHCICHVVTRTRPPICLSFDFNLQCPLLGPLYMEWGTPVWWGWFPLFWRSGGHKTKETYPTKPGSPTPCKQGLSSALITHHTIECSNDFGCCLI